VRHDDAILPATRWLCWVVVAVLIPALVVLWGFPGHTEDLWAWPIKADPTQIFMGAGYGAGAYFFTRAALGTRWHAFAAGILSAAFFALIMLVVTVIHWDKFNHGDAPFWAAFAFYAWVFIYIASPVVLTAFWRWNGRTDPKRPEPGEPIVSAGVRLAAQLVSGGLGATALALLLWPSIGVDHGPWELTPLTTRVLAAFMAQVSFGALLLSLDERWGTWRALLQAFLVATSLLLVGMAREWGDLETGRVSAWIFLGGLVGMAAAILALHQRMETRAATPAPAV
jgi:hypothetical protein